MPTRIYRSHRRSAQRRRPGLLAATAILAALAIIAAVFTMARAHVVEDGNIVAAINEADSEFDPVASIDVGSFETGRPNYRYSVIPGGAFNAVELRTAIRKDPVVAAHYEHLDQSRLRVERVSHDRYVHVSYRKGERIFWTKSKVLLRQGETILTDGTTQVRARCGNCISEDPLQPTADEEPETVEFDRLTEASAPRAAHDDEPILMPTVLDPALDAPVTGSITQLLNDADPVASGYFRGSGAPMPLGSRRNTSTPSPDSAGGESSLPGASDDRRAPLPPGGTPVVQPPVDFFPSTPGAVSPGIDSPFPPLGGNPNVPPTVIGDLPPLPGSPGEPVPVPEPGTLFLLGGGVAAMFRMLRSRAS